MRLSKLLFTTMVKIVGAKRVYNSAANARRRELSSELRQKLGHSVLTGLFRGMVILDDHSWGDSDVIAKIAGTYESDLRSALLKAIERNPPVVINVGCAEGYYAVGLARLLPAATVYAFDIDSRARTLCARAATENDVSDRVVLNGLCTTEDLSKLAQKPGRTLIIMDCEGAERELLDPTSAPILAECDIIVETHDFIDPQITSMLQARLSPAHEVERISQGGRNPNEIPELARLSELDRWLAISENRPQAMTWLACWAK